MDRLLGKSIISPFPIGTKEEGGNTRLRVMGRWEPIRTTGEKAWHSVYSVLPGECESGSGV
jgi:hypothetical protein